MEGRLFPPQEYVERPLCATDVIIEELRAYPDTEAMRTNMLGLERRYRGSKVVQKDESGDVLSRMEKSSALINYYRQMSRQFTAVRQYTDETAPIDNHFAFYAGELMLTHAYYRFLPPIMRRRMLTQIEMEEDDDIEESLRETQERLNLYGNVTKELCEDEDTKDLYAGLTLVAELLYDREADRDSYVQYFLEGAAHATNIIDRMLDLYNQASSMRRG